MLKKKNVMPEIGWSQLRHRFKYPGFADMLDVGVNNGLMVQSRYPPGGASSVLLRINSHDGSRRRELDSYGDRINNT
ncbi:hypothetical protein K438DRAFT_2051573, partial [Mycena galopus ATCC 62051]